MNKKWFLFFVLLIFCVPKNLLGQHPIHKVVEELESIENPDSAATALHPYLDSAIIAKDAYAYLYVLSALNDIHIIPFTDKATYVKQGDELFKNSSHSFFQADADSSVYFRFLDVKAEMLYSQGNYTDAIVLLKRLVARNKLQSVEDSLYMNAYDSYLGSSYLMLGNKERAIYYYNHYLNVIPEAVKEYYGIDYWYFYQVLGWTYLGSSWPGVEAEDPKENFERAISCYKKALDLIEHIQDKGSFSNTILSTYSLLINLYVKEGDYDHAIFYLNQSEKYQNSKSYKNADLLSYQSKLELQKNNFRKSLQLYDSALVLRKVAVGEMHYSDYEYHLGKAQVYDKMMEYTSALSEYKIALKLLRYEGGLPLEKVKYHMETIRVLHAKANTLTKMAQDGKKKEIYKEALTHYEQALALSLKERERIIRSESKHDLIAGHRKLINDALKCSYQAQKLLPQEYLHALVFDLIEKGKGLLLLENYRQEEALRKAVFSAEIKNALDEAELRLTSLTRRLRESNDEAIFEQLKEAEESYDSIMNVIKVKYPQFNTFKDDYEELSLAEFQNNITNSEACFSYYVADSAIYLLAIHQNQSKFIAIDNSRSIEQQVQKVHQFLRTPGPSNGIENNLYSLYNQLIKPGVDLIGEDKSIIIFPDSYLGYLPFEVLLSQSAQGEEYGSWPFLIKINPISYDFSATVYQHTSGWAFQNKNYIGFAPEYDDGDIKDLMVDNGAANWLAERDYGSLQYNGDEVKYASQLFDGIYYEGNKASEENFRAQAENNGLLHLSMHAFFDEKNPDHSGLVFSNFQPNGLISNEDGFVPMVDLYNMHINAEMVILSACETGYGYLERGEGVASIGRAFKYAGCPSVTMSLWNANDQSTSEVMKYFLEQLHAGMSKDEALRAAKLKYLGNADNNTAHPYYWSAFVLNGPVKPLTFAETSIDNYWWLLLVFGGVAILSVALYAKKKA
ncbi:CHAT domain-containing protein [Fulvivirga ligni]|uniref:CHAT domain-containing protein n=1 Tax=Fulvivirga ligni TaxID=2904246 RepID=UPI001F3C39DE|nr:CHAT domain-containing tetratricopeptide repeat protein [Fulvivirga ligni]UII21200.1 CHAT domain-containing protein [Fulvivirga ligni]